MPVHQEKGFIYTEPDNYNVEDPTGVRDRGYKNPLTGEPYGNHQPYAENIANAMEHEYIVGKHHQMTRANDMQSLRYFQEFMAHKFPNRP
jgi:hypothetical protein